jgi:2-polyprenyl-6-methoxyphenol hydroxylase-like FAD-dependent oxidoreductase
MPASPISAPRRAGPLIPGPLIIGGGPSGAAAAALLAAAGHEVTLLERHAAATDKLCGDFLSGGALATLAALGLDARGLGGVPIRSVRLVHRDAVAEAALPFPALGLSRRALDEALLALAARRGATIRRGHAVQALQPTRHGFTARLDDGSTYDAADVFLATGKHDLRGLQRPRRATGWLGLKMYYALAPAQHAALQGRIELLLLRRGYAGLQAVEQGRAVLCALVAAPRYREVAGDWDALVAQFATESPLLAERLAGAGACLARPLAIADPPYGHLHRVAAGGAPGLFRLGDQACVVPSLAGDGMAIALHSAVAATGAWLRGDTAAAYHAGLARRAAPPLRFAGLMHAACRRAPLQALLVRACRTWPAALSAAAAFSRVAPLA